MTAIFGLGLIGSAVLSCIAKSAAPQSRFLPFGWNVDDQRDRQAKDILRHISDIVGLGAADRATRIDIVWTAGKGGFQASTDEFSGEMAAFHKVLSMAQELSEMLPAVRHGFHLVSSAGGLFEGQRLVGQNSTPQPQRAYGSVKLNQEEALASLRPLIDVSIYRPSSIYGYKAGGRAGLVSTLVSNAIHNRTTRIFGNLDTLRDYVFVRDIGRFISKRVAAAPDDRFGGSSTYLLASGKPTSMHEIVRVIETKLQRKLFLKFDAVPWNASHMSFRPSALPRDWRTTAPSLGMQLTINEIMNDFLMPG